MITYTYNLRSLGYSEDEYSRVSRDALRLAQSASVVDTGRYKRGWQVQLSGDLLLVKNAVRYAPYVELGSIVYIKHRYKVRRALSTLGLTNGTQSAGNYRASFSVPAKVTRDEKDRILQERTTTGSTDPVEFAQEELSALSIAPLTDQEIRSPALLLRRTTQRRQQTISRNIPTGQLFNRSRLIELIAAAGIANQITNDEE